MSGFVTGRAVAVITAGFLTVSIAYAIRYCYGILLPEMVAELSISKTEAGVVASAYYVAYTLFSPLLGLLSDRYDVRVILSIFTALLAGGAFCMAFSGNVLTASLFFAVAGIGHAACWVPVVSLVQRWVPDHRRGMALSVTTLGTGFGITFWSFLLPVLIKGYSWRTGWMALGAFGFCVALLNYLLVRSRPGDSGARNMQQEGSSLNLQKLAGVYRGLLAEKKLWMIGLAYLLVGFTVLVPFTFLSAYAIEELAFSHRVAGRFFAAMAISGMAGKLLLGILSDSLGRIRVMIACGLLLGIGCLGMAFSRNLFALYGFTVIFGLGWGAVWPVYAASARDFFASDRAGSVIGLWTVFLGAGSVVSPALCGWTIDATGTYLHAFVLGCIGGILSAVLLIPVMHAPKADNRMPDTF